MRQDTAATRAKILTVAEKLFAAKGVEHVTLGEINDKSGQKNRSALQYHFGGKQQLVDAIMEKYLLKITADRNQLLDAIDRDGEVTSRLVAEAIVIPLANCLSIPGGLSYIQIAAQLIGKQHFPHLFLSDIESHFSSERIWGYISQVQQAIPEALIFSRVIVTLSALFHSLASYAQAVQSPQALPQGLDNELFVLSLVDSVQALLEQSPSAQTLAKAQAIVKG
ncbi:hypothetical protein SIN8267_01270 [Sinobacterium norvegicum]|uniref:HTH tetR-type domain-containing protein n=1 Tax=Sinobacterium norvegicum TaxID=1641715 RepID=A0ABM9AD86_9GAMM|nr:TetR family transcriptional regulator [Sinobacterium norvegicum]CAH0991168.1 hypothetical protein SIN8267_01270 [Sinobacterium norvegicum]